jgi:hypothetical protein
MGDPVSAGVVGSVVAPSATAAIANPITASMLGGAAAASSPSVFGTPIFGQGSVLSNFGQAAGAYNQFNQLFGQPEQRMQPIGASVRQGGQIQPMDYMSLLNPQQQTVIRPATPSLI